MAAAAVDYLLEKRITMFSKKGEVMNAIKYWRLERQMSQVELNLATGIPRYKIQQFELGICRPNEDELTTISLELGIAKEKLMTAKSEAANAKTY